MASVQQLLLRMNDTLADDVQAAFRCGICMSTMKEPWVTACNHPFCKDCLFACFGRTTRIECPMCRQTVQKRGCGASEQMSQLVDAYLRMAGAFKSELKKAITGVIPPERRFLESQAMTQFVAPSPKAFTIPNLPKKRPMRVELEPAKRAREDANLEREEEENSMPSLKTYSSDEESEPFERGEQLGGGGLRRPTRNSGTKLARLDEVHEEEAEPEVPGEIVDGGLRRSSRNSGAHQATPSPSARAGKKDDAEAEATVKKPDRTMQSDDFPVISVDDLKRIVEKTKASNPGLSNVDALFAGIPGIKEFFMENISDFRASFGLSPIQERTVVDDILSQSASTANIPMDDDVVTGVEGNKENRTAEVSDADEEEEEDVANITLDEGDETALSQLISSPIVTLSQKPYSYASQANIEKIVFAVSRLENMDDQALVQQFTAAFPQLTMISEVEDGCTHLVMMNSDDKNLCANKSLRFVFAVARGCEIVGRKWLEECLNQNRILVTDDFAVRIDVKKDTEIFNHRRGEMPWRHSRREPKLFAGKKFWLPAKACESKVIPREKVVELIQLCGGEVTGKIWELTKTNSAIIFAPCSKEADDARRYEADTKVEVYTVDYILDAIANYELPKSTKRYRVANRQKSRS